MDYGEAVWGLSKRGGQLLVLNSQVNAGIRNPSQSPFGRFPGDHADGAQRDPSAHQTVAARLAAQSATTRYAQNERNIQLAKDSLQEWLLFINQRLKMFHRVFFWKNMNRECRKLFAGQASQLFASLMQHLVG